MANHTQFEHLDISNMYGSVGAIPDQVEAAWAAIADRTFPDALRRCKHLIVAGMGGSAIGTHLIQSVFRDRLSVPVTIISDYRLPAWAGRDTLILLSSYSGGTEEVTAVAEYGEAHDLPMIVLTTGGDLAAFAETHDIPAVIFKSEHNPCGQPRIGLGYAVTYQLGMLRQLGFIDLTDGEMGEVLSVLRSVNTIYADLTAPNPALDLAYRARLRVPLIIASEHLTGNAHILANQWNENAKNMAAWFVIPELNHHLLEGLAGPPAVRNRLVAVLLHSKLYDDRNQKRYDITKQVLDEQEIASFFITPHGQTPLEQAFDTLLLGAYASFYQAVLNKTNPSPIPWVDYFKRLMSE
jgi:glucose/mannose-6-phosphate isomerase